MVEAWREDYNELRPHSSLDHRAPSEYVVRWQQIRAAQKAEFLTLETVL
ncbi:MAG: transposase [Acidobacteria bacterium]|nr:transposase [Acidobacteriota bacterium]